MPWLMGSTAGFFVFAAWSFMNGKVGDAILYFIGTIALVAMMVISHMLLKYNKGLQ